MEVYNFRVCRPLLAGAVPVTGWLFGVENSRVYFHVWFEERPEQVVGDLTIFEKCCKTGRGGCVGSTDVLHEQTEMLRATASVAFKLGSMGFQFRDVVM